MRVNFSETGLIPLPELLLDQNNYRLGPLNSQLECIDFMIRDFRDKMINLIKDISRRGISIEPIVVSKNNQDRWVVRDGNRRVAALKLLNNPSEAPDDFRAFIQSMDKGINPGTVPEAINCWTAEEKYIVEYMDLLHMGEQEGVGPVKWDSRAKDNFRAARMGKLQNPEAMAICDYLIKQNVPEARNVPITNIQRLVQDPTVSRRLGILFNNNGTSFTFIAEENEVFEILKTIIFDFSKFGEKKVADIYDPQNRQNYVDELFGPRGLRQPRPLDKPVNPRVGTSPASPVSLNLSTAGTPVNRKAPRERKWVIQRNAGLNIPKTQTKLQTILVELASKIDVRQAPIAAGVLVRLVADLSVEEYLTKKGLTISRDFSSRIIEAAQCIHKSGKIDKNQLKILEKMSSSNQLISTHTLNSWVHSSNYFPTPSEVCTFWDNIYFFLVECWK